MQSLPKVFIGGIFCFLFYEIRLFFWSGEQISTYLLTAIHMDYMSNSGCHYCSYTPISPPDSKGYFDLLIKVRDLLPEIVYFQFHQSGGMRSGITYNI